ncbi:MAG: nickel pincer cofactor biosynthesis protein LarC [Lachnospiraceae bacterium]|nr:nickel pincer cofactor biosynthesis protein LarC [Lachnospiraceae bacterium]
MGRTLYIECNSGISGDMTVAALLDLGADREVLERVLRSVPAEGFEIKISRVKKSGIDCMDFSVELEDGYENHDHDMEYLYGHDKKSHGEHSHDREHSHEENDLSVHHEEHGMGHHEHGAEYHEHNEEHHDHSTGHHGHGAEYHEHSAGHHHPHSHVHRGLKDVLAILEKTEMTDGARNIAERIFRILAEAEAKAHGLPVEEVHFLEGGAIDSIVDVISAAVCFNNLGISEVIVPGVCEGKGTVRCAHGILPIPVPAVANIMEKYMLPVCFIEMEGELVTPTGAAILAAMMTSEKLPDTVRIEKTGIGAGKRAYERPSILRMMLLETQDLEKDLADKNVNENTVRIQEADRASKDFIYKLETNLDDCTGESLGYVMEKLFEAGARDVHYTPVYMKKNRPGWQLNVLCEQKDIEKMEQIIFFETTTIGIRRIPYERTILPRKMEKLLTKFGEAEVKVCDIGEKKRYYPEYESVAKISREKGVSYPEVYKEVLCAIDKWKKQ